MRSPLTCFAEQVGFEDPVCCVGGRTQWDIGGLPIPGTREVKAPAGIVAHEPAEMIVRVRAGTTVAELAAALAERGQRVALEEPWSGSGATVGGVLSVGRSGVRRLGFGPVRDSVLEVTAVTARGELVRSGAPLVKNVTGYDLCRLFTGSLGTLALIGEVVLRCQPLPEVERWYAAEGADPFGLLDALYRPLSILWDGARTWVGLAGFGVDVEEQASSLLGPRFSLVEGPPALPGPGRRSMAPARLRQLPDMLGPSEAAWVAEIGVGIVHCDPQVLAKIGDPPPPAPGVVELNRRLKANFDPLGRLNPGRQVLMGAGNPDAPAAGSSTAGAGAGGTAGGDRGVPR